MVNKKEQKILKKYKIWQQYLGKEQSKFKEVSNPVANCNSCSGGGGGCGGCGGP